MGVAFDGSFTHLQDNFPLQCPSLKGWPLPGGNGGSSTGTSAAGGNVCKFS